MRQVTSLSIALMGAVGLLGMAGMSYGQTVVNGDFESPPPTNPTDNTSETADGWTLLPAAGDNYTNTGKRCTFDNPTPSGGTWSLWLQTFVQQGGATQTISSGITPGINYTMSAEMAFQLGNGGAGAGYNGVTQANQATDPKTQVTGDLYSYLELQFLNNHGVNVGTPVMTTIPAGSVPVNGLVTPWAQYSVSGVAPAGAAGVELLIGWQNGGLDGGTGGNQSAFATDVTLVPEPASLGMLAIGGVALLSRRRAKKLV